MESIRQWFQDWSDACEYAKECAPDFSFLSSLAFGEPYTALLSIAGLCFLLWAWNERGIKRAVRTLAAPEALAAPGRHLDATLDRRERDASSEKKLAA